MSKRNKKDYVCKVCGRPTSHADNFCKKHWSQINEYGFPLDDNSRYKDDPNEYEIKEDYVEVFLYDFMEEKIDDVIKIDLEDIDLIKDIRWDKKQNCIVGNVKGRNVLLPNYILDTDNKIEYINGNIYDNRKENLKIIEKNAKIKKVDKRKKGKIEITSLGTSTTGVTGSCWAIEYDKSNGTRGLILLENGICQGGTVAEDYNANKRMADYIPYDRAEFMLFSHPHGDHLLLAPASISRGFCGKVIMTEEQRVIGEKLLLDGAFIHDRNIKDLHKMGKKVDPLFTESDTYLFMNKIQTINKYEWIRLNEEVEIRYVNNSHVLGAVQIEIKIKKPSNHIVKILYTGDLGSKLNLEFQPFLQENEIVKKADIMICESTYGSSSRGFTKQQCIDERKDLMNTIHEVINKKTLCLIPSFSFSRSQTLMCMLYEEFKDIEDLRCQFIIDSRLTCEINSAYREILKGEEREYFNKVMAWDRFKFISNYKDTMDLATKNDGIPRIIISSSGFMEAGHVREWAKQILGNKNAYICFVGYGGSGTLADRIRHQNSNEINIDGITCIRRCNIKEYGTFSSHIQQKEIIDYFKQIAIGHKILLHHGDEDAKNELKQAATKELREIGKTTKIVVVGKGCDTFTI